MQRTLGRARLHCNALHCSSLQWTAPSLRLVVTALLCSSLQWNALHCTALQVFFWSSVIFQNLSRFFKIVQQFIKILEPFLIYSLAWASVTFIIPRDVAFATLWGIANYLLRVVTFVALWGVAFINLRVVVFVTLWGVALHVTDF